MKARPRAFRIGLLLLASWSVGPGAANLAEVPPGGQGIATGAAAITLRIVDERVAPSPQDGDTLPGTELVPSLIRRQVAAYLVRKGFLVTDIDDPNARSLSIEIRTFEYERMTGGLSIGIRTGFRAVALGGGQYYAREYGSKVVHHVYVMPSPSNNEDWVRLGLDDVMPQLYKDTSLSGFLKAH